MNDKPRQILIDLITEHGPTLAENPRRVEAFLRDLCGKHKPEIFVLVNALKLGVANDLLAPNGVPAQLLLPRLAQRLVDSTAIAAEAATWAVESWALALNGKGQGQSPDAQPSVRCPACGEPVSPKAKFCAQCGRRLEAATPAPVKPAPKPAVSPPPAPKPSPSDPSTVERNRLIALMTNERQPPRERAKAGDELAKLGDNRPGVGVVPLPGQPALPQLQFCYIPPGPFWLGDNKGNRDEQPCHRVELPHGYWLARYPVTVAQWQAFVQTGYQPQDADSLRDPLNRPVRDVTWYEAVAYCRWLTRAWQVAGVLSADWVVRLPSEAEWEKAARGGTEIPVKPQTITMPEDADAIRGTRKLRQQANRAEKRRYPWGEQIEANRLNYGETGIGTTSAVGCFSGGRSPYGCEEMSGNVWEWCSTVWDGNAYPLKDIKNEWNAEYLKRGNARRVMRGGAFLDFEDGCRCAYRYHEYPYGRYGDLGFRVLLSPKMSL